MRGEQRAGMRCPGVALFLVAVAWGATRASAVNLEDAQRELIALEDAPSADQVATADIGALAAKTNGENPFLPATDLVKTEENATGRVPFTGRFRDIDSYIYHKTREVAKEVFGGTEEVKLKADKIKQSETHLKQTNAEEAKMLNISMADAMSPVGSPPIKAPKKEKPKPGASKPKVMPKLDFAGDGAKKKEGLMSAADLLKAKKAAAQKAKDALTKLKRGSRTAGVMSVKKALEAAAAKEAAKPCTHESCGGNDKKDAKTDDKKDDGKKKGTPKALTEVDELH